MADLRRSVNTRIWSDEWFETLKPTEKLLWLYLLTNERTNMLGCYEVSMKRISYESGIDESMVRKAFEGFQRLGKAYYLGGKYVFLPNWLKNQSMNTNMVKSAKNDYQNLPIGVLEAICEIVGKGFESLSKGYQTLPKIESEIEIEIESESSKRKRFVAPTLDEVKNEMGNDLEADKFFDFYTSKGWKVGKTPMVDWRASVRTWKRNMNNFAKNGTPTDLAEVYKGFKPL